MLKKSVIYATAVIVAPIAVYPFLDGTWLGYSVAALITLAIVAIAVALMRRSGT